MDVFSVYRDLNVGLRLVVILTVAGLGHMAIRYGYRGVGRIVGARSRGDERASDFARLYPKLATVLSLLASALTVLVYFVAVGLALSELDISITAYLATASVFGLAIGFGSQSLVQDVVIGLTLVFSDAIDIGDMVEMSGQVGRVEQVGLRFTTIVNFLGQRVYVPNRNITLVGRFRGDCVRAYVDVHLPDTGLEGRVRAVMKEIAAGVHAQHRAIVLTPPEVFESRPSSKGTGRYVRVKFRIWPGQQALIENAVRQRTLSALKKMDGAFEDWMVTVTYRVT